MNQIIIHDFIGLLRSALGIATFESEKVQWNQMLKLALSHHVEVMMYEAISQHPSGSQHSAAVLSRLEQEVMTAVIQDANQISEVESLIEGFEHEALPAIMLKGWIIKDLYPRTDFRSRADTDIFIRSEDEKNIHDVIMSHGYANHSFGGKKDNVYYKEPFITLEMHKNLFMYEDEWNMLFNDENGELYIWKRTELLEGYKHIYRMDVNMYYVYHLAHMVKHLISGGGGIGIKAIMDLWLYRSANEDRMDLDRISKDLQTMGMTKFADTVWKLAKAWFSGEQIEYPDESIRQFGSYIIDCGAYGHSDNFVANNEAMRNAKKPTRIGYIFHRAFPPRSSMEKRFPRIKKHSATLPYYWAKRLWRDGVRRKKEVMGEVNSAWNVDYSRVEAIQKQYQEWGIPQVD